jgi:hypothetical protein
MKYSFEIASDGMINIPSFMTIDLEIISTIRQASVLVLLLAGIYDICR